MDGFKHEIKGRALTSPEELQLVTFLDFLRTRSNKVRIIYRGENYNNLKQKLHLHGNCDFSKLSDFTFLIGDKGRVYRSEYKKRITNKHKVYSIDAISEKIILYIFNKLSLLFSKSIKPEVLKFKINNPEFANYFLEKNHQSDFKKKFDASDSTEEKIKIRDFYLTLLHQIGQVGFYTNSFFVSTTKDFDVAKRFSQKDKTSEAIIFVSWITYPIYNQGIHFNHINNNKSKIRKLGLPVYDKSLFPRQHEVLVKGGLMPHYILGYLRLKKKIFEINPHFLKSQQDFFAMIHEGFEIDQTNFSSTLQETDYSGYFLFDNGTYSDVNSYLT